MRLAALLSLTLAACGGQTALPDQAALLDQCTCSAGKVCYTLTCDKVAAGLHQCSTLGVIERRCDAAPATCSSELNCKCLLMSYYPCSCQEPRTVDCLIY